MLKFLYNVKINGVKAFARPIKKAMTIVFNNSLYIFFVFNVNKAFSVKELFLNTNWYEDDITKH